MLIWDSNTHRQQRGVISLIVKEFYSVDGSESGLLSVNSGSHPNCVPPTHWEMSA